MTLCFTMGCTAIINCRPMRNNMAKPTNPLKFEDRDQWQSWLEVNHTTEREAWLLIYKKVYKDLGLALEEAVEEALCFGWIDGTLRTIDERCYTLRFSPRTKNSIWSMSNIQRVEKLAAEGKMTDAGILKVAEAKANGEWEAAIRREQVDSIPKDLEVALRKQDGALSAYKALPASHKKQYIYWLQSAKRGETKQQRIQKIVDEVLNQ
jgi:uncharacterized protein YdeI (YjbR/CyaY-like superfamily)